MQGIWEFDIATPSVNFWNVDDLLHDLRSETGTEKGEWYLKHKFGPGGGNPTVTWVGDYDTIKKWFDENYCASALEGEELEEEFALHHLHTFG